MTWRAALPAPLRARIEVNTYLMNRLLAATAATLPAQTRVLDAGAGEGRFRPLFAHTRYTGVDLAVAAAEKLIAAKVDAGADAALFKNSVDEVKTRLN